MQEGIAKYGSTILDLAKVEVENNSEDSSEIIDGMHRTYAKYNLLRIRYNCYSPDDNNMCEVMRLLFRFAYVYVLLLPIILKIF
jgi:hypothetical protein